MDIMVRVKLNRFHWHLTDDQGWRIQIDKFPKLVSIGSIRGRSQIGGLKSHLIKRYDEEVYSGHYSVAEVQELIEYARKRQITIIPEIDLPGHSSALLAAYPHLACGDNKYLVQSDFGIINAVLCPGKDSSYEFLASLFAEIADIFPGGYIHLGGDEVRTKNWDSCGDCQARISAEGIPDTKGLMNYFINRVSKIIIDNGKTPIGWNEVLDDDLDEKLVFQHWMGGGKKILNHLRNGRKGIISRFFYFYLDYNYHLIPLKKTYHVNPIPKDLGRKFEENILGVEATLWTEWIRDERRLFWQLLPRLFAVAELAWTRPENKSYSRFLDDLDLVLKLVNERGVTDQREFDPAKWSRFLPWNIIREPRY